MNIRLYLSSEQTCNYLEQEESRSLFVDPAIKINSSLISQLSQNGFRRNGSLLYRPHCNHCNKCMSCRVICRDFKPSNSQKKILRKAKLLDWKLVPMKFTQEHYYLYQKYIEARHIDGDMYPASEQQYQSFLICGDIPQLLLEIRTSEGLLICGAAVDCLDDGFSAVYSYFDPDFSQLSLGKLIILRLIEHCQSSQLAYVYLGYWIENCRKMAYKKNYPPMEFFNRKQWISEPVNHNADMDL
ncbi:arginyltransferase [Pelagibaculum spongiae]|nr:arginyltransferase [Pelagibaculum spongiae]